MPRQRRNFTAEFKTKVVLEAIKGQRTVSEIAQHYSIHPNLIIQWKKQALAHLPGAFSDRTARQHQEDEQLKDELYRQIGQLRVELEWLKKEPGWGVEQKRQWIEPSNDNITIARQCALLGLSRSSLYYEPKGITQQNLLLMRLIDEQYTRRPFFGSPKITDWLRKQGHLVNHKRVERLMRVMGLQAICPKRRLSQPAPGHRIYPYLLRGVKAERPNQVWSADITYIRLERGFVYLVAVMDWFSRYVLAWEVSTTLDTSFCISALEWALASGAQPEIFNTDQGAQFTSTQFTGRLMDRSIQISMDGRGRALDNVFVERLWRSLKYEEIYLNDYPNIETAVRCLKEYFDFYNHERSHQSLGYRTPAVVYGKSSEDLSSRSEVRSNAVAAKA